MWQEGGTGNMAAAQGLTAGCLRENSGRTAHTA